VNAQLKSWAVSLGGEVSGRGVICPGPGHSARDRSLSVMPSAGAPDGFLVHSFSGDDPIACKDYVRAKLGQPEFKPNGHAEAAKKTYFDYCDETGAVIYQVERTDYYDGRKKKFSQRRPDPARPGEWLWNLGGVRPVPYRLPGVIEAAANGHLIAIAEGEAKVDLLWSWNIPATCNSGGAQKWKAEHSAYLSGADIVILPDNDPAGRLHLDAVAVSLKEAGATVRVLDLPGLGPKGDVLDWAKAGGTVEQLHALIENEARPWAPSERLEVNSKQKFDFPLIAFENITFAFDEEWRVDRLFPLVGLVCLYGLPGSLKSFILQDLFLRMARGGFWGGREVKQCPVIYIAAEASSGTKKRLFALWKVLVDKGVSPAAPFFLITVAPNLGTGDGDCKKLIASIEGQMPPGTRAGALALDTTSQSMGGADENGAGMDMLVINATVIANHFQCLVVLVHHTPVSDDQRLRGKGSLRGGIDGSILSESVKGSKVATLTVMKMRDEDDVQSFTVRLKRIVLGETKNGHEVSTLIVETVEPGAAEDVKQDKRKAAEILHDEFIAAYDRLADGVPKSLGLDLRSSVLKVRVEAFRDELKNRGLLETDGKGNLTATGRSHFQRAKAELVKTKGGRLVEEKGFIWRP
jgi:hypothetical protein